LLGAPLAKLVFTLSPGYEPHPVVKFRKVTPTTPAVICAHMWNFKPNLNVRPIKFFLGDPDPVCGRALTSLGQCLARVKNSGASTPIG